MKHWKDLILHMITFKNNKRMLKCKICDYEYDAVVERHYISRDVGKTGFSAVAGEKECTEYDTFDCPQCGCQHIVQERKRTVSKNHAKN